MASNIEAKIDQFLREKYGFRSLMCAYRYFRLDTIPKPVRRVISFGVLILFAKRFKSRNYVPLINLDITTRCTLNCKECIHQIPIYKKRACAFDINLDVLMENIALYNNVIEESFDTVLLGGEPFLNKQLHEIIKRLIPLEKIRNIRVITNGTIIPQGENFEALKHKKVVVSISNYGEISSKKDELVRVLRKDRIRVYVEPRQMSWVEFGNTEYRNYTDAQVERVFMTCRHAACKPLYDGKLWLCPLAHHATILGLVPEDPKNYIDLRTTSKDELFGKLDRMYDHYDDYSVCRYCGGCLGKKVPAAEQC